METCSEFGIQPIAYSPLALGLLADKYTFKKYNICIIYDLITSTVIPTTIPCCHCIYLLFFSLPGGIRGLLYREYLPALTPLLGELRAVAKERKKTVSQVKVTTFYFEVCCVRTALTSHLNVICYRVGGAQLDLAEGISSLGGDAKCRTGPAGISRIAI